MSDKLWKLLIFCYLSLSFLSSAFTLLWLMNGGLATDWRGSDWSIIRENAFYYCAGTMGGSLYALRLFHQYYDLTLPTRFIYWYIMRPYLCGGTAIVTMILFDSGILLLQAEDSMPARTGLSFLVGFGYGKFMEKLTHLTEALFNGNDKGNGNNNDTGNGSDKK